MDPAGMVVPDGTNVANCIAMIVFAFLGIILNMVPSINLIRVRNLSAVTLVVANIVTLFWIFVNAIIWHNDDQATWFSGHGLCDLQVAMRSPWYTLTASATCRLIMDLARAVDVDNPRLFENKSMRRRRIVLDVLFIFGVPFVQLCLHYLIQVHRYALVAVYGCGDFVDNSWASIVLMSIWPLLFGLLTCIYAVVTIHRLRRHHGRLSSTLSGSGSGLDARKFVKLFLVVLVVLLLYLPLLVYFFYTNWPATFSPYSFAAEHGSTWGAVVYLHITEYPEFQYWNWSPILLSIVIFCWYGMNSEAVNCYRCGLLKLGLGHFWPTLHRPYYSNRSTGSRSSRKSWTSTFDIVSKAVNFMDSKNRSDTSLSRTIDSQTNTESTYSRQGSVSKPGTSSIGSNSDIDTPAPIHNAAFYKHGHGSAQELESRPHIPLPPPRTMFSAFRTQINLPFPLFTSTTRSVSTPNRVSHPIDLEKQGRGTSTAEDNHAFTTERTVETNIWSGSVHEHEDEHPLSPKLGSRAYRERERREKQQQDEVVAMRQLEIKGVAVRKDMVMKEEFAEGSSARH